MPQTRCTVPNDATGHERQFGEIVYGTLSDGETPRRPALGTGDPYGLVDRRCRYCAGWTTQ
jgi:hypothetical protein